MTSEHTYLATRSIITTSKKTTDDGVMTQSTTDVLIIGGGPTGTTLALELAVNNIPFRLVDKVLCRSDKSRALAVQPRTLELLNRHGHVHELIQRGNQGSGGTFFIHGKRIVDLDFSDTHAGEDTIFPNTLMISQSDTERFLDERLAQHGHAVEFGLEAMSIAQDADGVTATLRNVQGAKDVETIRAKYVVGADGAHSAVRHAAKDITFDGAAYPQDFILCDTRIRNSVLPWNRFSVCWGYGTMVVFPLKDGMVRIVASRPDHHADEEEEPQLQDFQDWIDCMAPGGGELYDPFWLARFRLHHRVASNYRQGRLFVAGDAAHIHSPAGGQGMNTGSKWLLSLPARWLLDPVCVIRY